MSFYSVIQESRLCAKADWHYKRPQGFLSRTSLSASKYTNVLIKTFFVLDDHGQKSSIKIGAFSTEYVAGLEKLKGNKYVIGLFAFDKANSP